MGEPCSTPGQTPMDGVLMNGLTGLLQRTIRMDQPESTKRFLMLLAGLTLCACMVLLTLAVWYQAVLISHVDGGLNFALGIISGSVAALAGVAYRKPETTPAPVAGPAAE